MAKAKKTPGKAAAKALSWLKLGALRADAAAKAVFAQTEERIGYVRTTQRLLAHKPALLLAQEGLSRAVMRDPDGSLSDRERELIALVVSSENRCQPCVFGHAAELRRITGDALWVGKVEVNHRHADLGSRERAIADYVLKITRAPGEIEEADLAPLRAAGLADTEILEAAAVAAYFNFSNRINNALGIAPNPEAYAAHR
jgi:uncharacterized peroxidase-related enzyme